MLIRAITVRMIVETAITTRTMVMSMMTMMLGGGGVDC